MIRIPSSVWLAAVVLMGAMAGYQALTAYNLKLELARVKFQAASERALYDAERASASQALAKAHANAARVQAELQALADENRRLKDETVQATRAAAAAVRERVRVTATLPGVPNAPSVPSPPDATGPEPYQPGTLGAQLRGAAGPLVDEAERGDLLRAELIECRRAYAAARTLSTQ